MKKRTLYRLLTAVVFVLVVASGVLAAEPSATVQAMSEEVRPSGFWGWLVPVVLMIGVVVISFKDAKRSHLD